ncbi:hypothetical protein PUN28_012919 [Cardiocondyla obscurior]|uniref:Uncharacterized protein n=1 Tax=Cardiocondyla obscurior TaxID=286306 RepID=A0AAW2F9B6_9HYME
MQPTPPSNLRFPASCFEEEIISETRTDRSLTSTDTLATEELSQATELPRAAGPELFDDFFTSRGRKNYFAEENYFCIKSKNKLISTRCKYRLVPRWKSSNVRNLGERTAMVSVCMRACEKRAKRRERYRRSVRSWLCTKIP